MFNDNFRHCRDNGITMAGNAVCVEIPGTGLVFTNLAGNTLKGSSGAFTKPEALYKSQLKTLKKSVDTSNSGSVTSRLRDEIYNRVVSINTSCCSATTKRKGSE